MSVELLRIDSRLVHGQITTNWVKACKVNSVIVLSDELQKDNLQYQMIKAVTPHWLNVNILNRKQMLKLLSDDRFEKISSIIIVSNISDACFLIDNGLDIQTINFGSLKFESGKKLITETIALNQNDIEEIEYLHSKNIKLEIRKVFQDKSKDLWKILKDKKVVSR